MKKYFLAGSLAFMTLFSGCGLYVPTPKTTQLPATSDSSGTPTSMNSQYPPYQEIANPSGFINTPLDATGKPTPIKIGDLIGKKVIVVDFLTYTCINCIRTFPYLNAWYDKYKDQGLEIIGIHTPEFAFEHKYDNVVAAMKKEGIKFPVVLDNDYATWNVYGNQYWPRKYIIDINGNIVFDHIGEGGYDETEAKIRELLSEREKKLGQDGVISGDMTNPTNTISLDTRDQLSPETYFGAARNEFLANGKQGLEGMQHLFAPEKVEPDTLYLVGDWNFTPQNAISTGKNDRIIYHYHGTHVYVVASGASGKPVTVNILRDGKPLGSVAGEDVKVVGGQSMVTIQPERLYTLINEASYGDHTLEIIPQTPGLQAFTFTFG